MRYAYIVDGVIQSVGPLPSPLATINADPNLNVPTQSNEALNALGWFQLMEVGRRDFDSDIEVETIAPPVIENGIPIIYYSYAYKDGYKAILFSRVSAGANPANPLITPMIASPLDTIPDKVTALNDQERAVITATKAIATARGQYSNNTQKAIDYAGTQYQANAAGKDKLVQAVVAFADGTPDGYYWLDVQNAKVPASIDFLKGLLRAMTVRDFSEFQAMADAKEAARQAFMQGIA